MKSNDLTLSRKNEILTAMQKALRDNDTEEFTAAFDRLMEHTASSVRQDYEDLRSETDTRGPGRPWRTAADQRGNQVLQGPG